MPEVSRRQFWKADPNQQAFPGMEDVSHPGAKLLTQGYSFKKHELGDPGFSPLDPRSQRTAGLRVDAIGPKGDTAGYLMWSAQHKIPYQNPLGKGEIAMVETGKEHQKQGIATALYGIGRTMSSIKPRHSTHRTRMGDAWAPTTVEKYGGRVPKKQKLL